MLPVRTRGRAAIQVEAEVIRELDTPDLALLDLGRPAVAGVKAIRDSHHALAKMIAAGYSNAEISLTTGYSPSRISVLRTDPAMQELIEHYKDRAEDFEQALYRRLGILSGDIIAEIQSRLELDPESITTDELRKLAEFATDRSGLGPVSTQKNLNVNVDFADKLRAARLRAKEALPDAAG